MYYFKYDTDVLTNRLPLRSRVFALRKPRFKREIADVEFRTLIYGVVMGRDSSVGIATGYGLDGPGIEIFRTRPDRPWGPPSLLYNGYRVFPGGKYAGAWC
jgi:hypothetical protein